MYAGKVNVTTLLVVLVSILIPSPMLSTPDSILLKESIVDGILQFNESARDILSTLHELAMVLTNSKLPMALLKSSLEANS